MGNLKRKQIYLDEESDRALKSLAVATKISESEHIRRAIKRYVIRYHNNIPDNDPIEKLIGLCDSPDGPSDASVNHDKYLYGKKT
jgi:hypothetical protein